MAALGEMLLMGVCGGLALALGPHWAVSEAEAKAWGSAFEAWLKAQPAKRRKALTNALAAVPTLNLVVATAMVFAPRVQATLEMARQGKEVKGERQKGASGDSGGSGQSAEPPHGASYVAAIAKALGGDAGTASEGGGSGNPDVFPKA